MDGKNSGPVKHFTWSSIWARVNSTQLIIVEMILFLLVSKFYVMSLFFLIQTDKQFPRLGGQESLLILPSP